MWQSAERSRDYQWPAARWLRASAIVAISFASLAFGKQAITPPAPLPPELNVPKPPASMAPALPMKTSAPVAASAPLTTAYPSLAQMAQANESSTPLTPNVWLFTGLRMDEPSPTIGSAVVQSAPQSLQLAQPSPLPPGSVGPISGAEVVYSDADTTGPFWAGGLHYVPLPGSLLWEPPLANQREPRMYAKFTNANGESTIDTAIGGAFSIGRFAPEGRTNEGIEIDAMAAVFTRFNERRLLTAADYRVGMYAAYAKNDWSAKFGYEHTSTHLGDEYIQATGAVQVAHVRDELVFGLARRFWNQVRVYGEVGYSMSTSDDMVNDRDRYMAGVEWSKDESTGLRGQPFAALDMDVRSDQDYEANLTFQVGWQWKQFPSRQSARVALEIYNGRSPFGQFYQVNERWVGFTMMLDW